MRGQSKSKADNDIDSPTDYIVYSIKVLVDYYLEGECQEENLFISGVEGTTYKTIFKHIKDFNDSFLRKYKIYFSQVIYKNVGVFSDRIEFYLTDNGFDQRQQPINKSIVRLNISNWKEFDRQKFIEKIEKFKSDSCSMNNNISGGESRYFSWVFFLGNSSNKDNSEFRVLCDSWKFIDLRITNKLPPLKYYQSTCDHPESTGSYVLPTSRIEDGPNLDSETPEEIDSTNNQKPDDNIPENCESNGNRIIRDGPPDADSDLPAKIQPPSVVPPEDEPLPATETSGAIDSPGGEESQTNEVTGINKENSSLEKLQSLPSLLAILLVLLIAGLTINGVIEENNRDNQPTEEVQ